MDSWWDLGEWSGTNGKDLTTYDIVCPFCDEKGNFSVAFHAEKKKAQSAKKLNFDTLKCENCASYVMVMWSSSSFGNIHGKVILPRSLKVQNYPEHWPDAVGRYWLQAKSNLINENWEAAALMARSSLQIALRGQNAEGKNLKQEIDDLAGKGVLPNIMQEWAHNVRELGNESAHPHPDQVPTDPKDAKDIVAFMDYLFEYLYTLPKRINEYRQRKNS